LKRLWLETGSELQGNASLGEFNFLWAFAPDSPDSLQSLGLINHLWRSFANQGMRFLGLSTDIEHFDEDAEQRSQNLLHALLQDPHLELPAFPILMDHLHIVSQDIPENYLSFLCESIPSFHTWPLFEQEALRLKARNYLSSKSSWAVTARLNEFKRLPTWIIFNRYYEILEEWTGLPDPEEVFVRTDYWVSHLKSNEIKVDPF
jgi:hypothetical protein